LKEKDVDSILASRAAEEDVKTALDKTLVLRWRFFFFSSVLPFLFFFSPGHHIFLSHFVRQISAGPRVRFHGGSSSSFLIVLVVI
jgi:hypothetical protein